MKPKLSILLALLILLPAILVTILGIRLAYHEQEQTRLRFEHLHLEHLGDVDNGIVQVTSRWETELLQALSVSDVNAMTLKNLSRNHARIRQAFLLDPQGKLIYPLPSEHASSSELDFLDGASELILRKELVALPGTEASAVPQGWYSWYWGRDIRTLFWLHTSEGQILGAEIETVLLVSDIINALPVTQTSSESDLSTGLLDRTRLLNSRGEIIYQWGRLEVPEDTSPASRIQLSRPLSAWSLELYRSDGAGSIAGRGVLMTIIASSLALALVFVGFGIFLYRENSRELRESARRVSFVNQVSHELKTPLTNIRLYAELLDRRIDEDDSQARGYAGIIVSESRRLSRLIGNVLSLGRQREKRLTLHRRAGCIDSVIEGVLEQFRPALRTSGIAVLTDLQAIGNVSLDADLLEQVLGNLISNVEKYAASGEQLAIASRQRDGVTTLTVEDRGPGIPDSEKARVFEPFYRINTSLVEGVSGTGIGLSIARDLARLHGGDLKLMPSEMGAKFELTLFTPDMNLGE